MLQHPLLKIGCYTRIKNLVATIGYYIYARFFHVSMLGSRTFILRFSRSASLPQNDEKQMIKVTNNEGRYSEFGSSFFNQYRADRSRPHNCIVNCKGLLQEAAPEKLFYREYFQGLRSLIMRSILGVCEQF